MMKIDLHVHAKERSLCSASSEVALIETAIERGLDALVFTDHDRLVPKEHLHMLNARFAPFRVFGGIEVSLALEHVLVLGIHDKALESTSWTYPALHSFARKRNGFIALCHPFRFHRRIAIDIETYPPDAVEHYSNNTPRHAEARIQTLATKLNMMRLSNSDAHHTNMLGSYYNELACNPQEMGDLVMCLKTQPFELVCPPTPSHSF